MSILITNIKQLIQVHDKNVMLLKGKEMKELPVLKNAYLYLEHDTIIEYGAMAECIDIEAETVIDATDRLVLPSWCDSHTHLVFAGDRSSEFVDKINAAYLNRSNDLVNVIELHGGESGNNSINF